MKTMLGLLIAFLSTLTLGQLGPCAALADCQRFEENDHFVNFRCLTRLALPLLWDTNDCDVCGVYAILALAQQYYNYHLHLDVSSMFIALQAGQVIDRCGLHESIFPWSRFRSSLESEHSSSDLLLELFDAFVLSKGSLSYSSFYRAAFDSLLGTTESLDVMVVGVHLYRNEIIAAPSLHYPTEGLRVGAYIISNEFFPSHGVQMVHFPYALQVEVNAMALHLRETIRRLRPKCVIPTDSGGILALGKLAELIYRQCKERPDQCEHEIQSALEQSMSWPPVYPSPMLSKLVDGHEPFAPPFAVVGDSSQIEPDLERAFLAAQPLAGSGGSKVILKREYSAASMGVIELNPRSRRSIRKAYQKLLTRRDGIVMSDLDLPFRVFFQALMPLDQKPMGVRFYAHHGQFVAGHVSQVQNSTTWAGISYKTIRDEEAEKSTIDFVRAVNYTGFGAAWYWRDGQGKPKLIDFNARLERNACLAPVISPEMWHLEPCFLFQMTQLGRLHVGEISTPRFLPAEIHYYNPIRARMWGVDILEDFRKSEYLPNVWERDRKLFAHIESILNAPVE